MQDLNSKDQEKLRRLIALKGYEVPPPGYGNLLANRVISHLEVEQIRSQQAASSPWFKRFSLRPVLFAIQAMVMASLLWFGWQSLSSKHLPQTVDRAALVDRLELGSAWLRSEASTVRSQMNVHFDEVRGSLMGMMQASSIQPTLWTQGSFRPGLSHLNSYPVLNH
ncbi:MAG: hypothetical protein ACPGL0_03820 [Limisphaerales bacterium]